MDSPAFRTDIQGLRAIAVLAVMVFHFNPGWLPGGFVGVDVFLVLSGFLITSILLHKRKQAGYSLSATLKYFYASRFKRIAPAYFVMLVLVALVAAVFFLPQDFNTFKKGLENAAWFNSNNYFAGFGDYFAPANHEQPLLHTWSLAVEIQFYLLAPFIVLLLPIRWLKWIFSGLLIGLTAIAEYRMRIMGIEQATYYSLYARLPEFFAGSLVALYVTTASGRGRSFAWLGTLGLVLIIVAAIAQPQLGPFPGIAALLPVAGSVLLLSQTTQGWVGKLLSCKTLVWLGALSYSLYLWHWPVLAFLRYYTGAEVLNVGFGLLFVLLTLSLSIISYYGIERAFRNKRINKKQAFGWLLLATSVIGTSQAMAKVNSVFTPEQLPIEYQRYADPETICHGKMVGDCLKGNLSSDREVLVIGDSHAAMLNHFFDYLGKELGFKARIITASSCVTFPGFDYQRLPDWAQPACQKQIQEVSEYIDNVGLVIVGGMWSYQFEFDSFYNSLTEFIKSNHHLPVYFMPQIPLLDGNHHRVRRFASLGLQSVVSINTDYINANELLHIMITPYAEVNMVDNQISQKVWLSDVSGFYSDESHLNENGAVEYARINVDVFQSLIEEYYE